MHKQAVVFLTVITAMAVYQLRGVGQSLINDSISSINENFSKELQISSLGIDFEDLFEKWKYLNQRYYNSYEEQRYRLKIFVSNCRKIYNHNLHKDDYGFTYTLGLNQFSDLTKLQYIDRLTTYSSRSEFITHVEKKSSLLNLTLQCNGTITISPNPPDEVDWSKKATNPVMNQGQCGSSYAISAIGAVQGLYALRIGKLQIFSIQQIVDCSGGYGNEGCFGGFMDQAFWYIIDNGIATNKTYPLKNTTLQQKCTYTKAMKATSFAKCADVPSGNYSKLQSAVIQQPTSVAIDASELQHYDGGIYNSNCSNSHINQAMLIVGYGSSQDDKNQTYWKIKNSFGTTWGEQGGGWAGKMWGSACSCCAAVAGVMT